MTPWLREATAASELSMECVLGLLAAELGATPSHLTSCLTFDFMFVFIAPGCLVRVFGLKIWAVLFLLASGLDVMESELT